MSLDTSHLTPSSSANMNLQNQIFEDLSKHIHLETCRSVFAIGGMVLITSTMAAGLICESDRSISDTDGDDSVAGDGSFANQEREAGCKCGPVVTGQRYIPFLPNQDDEDYYSDEDNDWEQLKWKGHVDSKRCEAAKTVPKDLIDHKMRCDPITLRWDSPHNTDTSSSGNKLVLPCDNSSRPAFEQLLRDCQPASFGRDGVDVMDETYCKAGKIDEQDFCSNFNPYAIGIIDAIAQVLLPDNGELTNETRGLRAELYKLNVYSAPSGRFKPHVDTPRSKHQVGTLVVCLPGVHEGGQLVLRHQGRENVFDWSGEKGQDTIQWAAFYSDCEHEVLEVTSGHRLTLTYNLYATCHANTARVGLEGIELYKTLTKLIGEPSFCQEGLTLGYHCSHAYPHTNESVVRTLPATLKGIDKLVYHCFSATGLRTSLRQALNYDLDRKADRYFTGVIGPRSRAVGGDGPWRGLRAMYTLGQTANGACLLRKPQPNDGARLAVLSNKLVPVQLSNEGMYDGADQSRIIGGWTKDFEVARVRWLNNQTDAQMALVHGAYGNEASLDTKYSGMVITLEVPPFHER